MIRTETFSIRIGSPPQQVYAAFTDYERWHEWLRVVDQVRILAREGDVSIVEIVSSSRWGGRTVLEFVHTPPASVIWTQIGLLRQRGFSGSANLKDTEQGQATVLNVRLSVNAPLFTLPRRSALKEYLSRGMKSLKEKAESRKGLTRPPVRKRGRKILSLVRQGGKLELWYRGKSFLLQEQDKAGER